MYGMCGPRPSRQMCGPVLSYAVRVVVARFALEFNGRLLVSFTTSTYSSRAYLYRPDDFFGERVDIASLSKSKTSSYDIAEAVVLWWWSASLNTSLYMQSKLSAPRSGTLQTILSGCLLSCLLSYKYWIHFKVIQCEFFIPVQNSRGFWEGFRVLLTAYCFGEPPCKLLLRLEPITATVVTHQQLPVTH